MNGNPPLAQPGEGGGQPWGAREFPIAEDYDFFAAFRGARFEGAVQTCGASQSPLPGFEQGRDGDVFDDLGRPDHRTAFGGEGKGPQAAPRGRVLQQRGERLGLAALGRSVGARGRIDENQEPPGPLQDRPAACAKNRALTFVARDPAQPNPRPGAPGDALHFERLPRPKLTFELGVALEGDVKVRSGREPNLPRNGAIVGFHRRPEQPLHAPSGSRWNQHPKAQFQGLPRGDGAGLEQRQVFIEVERAPGLLLFGTLGEAPELLVVAGAALFLLAELQGIGVASGGKGQTKAHVARMRCPRDKEQADFRVGKALGAFGKLEQQLLAAHPKSRQGFDDRSPANRGQRGLFGAFHRRRNRFFGGPGDVDELGVSEEFLQGVEAGVLGFRRRRK